MYIVFMENTAHENGKKPETSKNLLGRTSWSFFNQKFHNYYYRKVTKGTI